MKFDHEKLATDFLIKLQREGIKQKDAAKRMNISEYAIWRYCRNGSDKLSTVLKILKWTGSDINNYLK